MTKEERQLLLKDLCARLPYGVKVNVWEYVNAETLVGLDINKQTFNLEYSIGQPIFSRHNDLIIKPYLRPMSSMTKEERLVYEQRFHDVGRSIDVIDADDVVPHIDWLLSHHFDYRGLIEKGLALKAEPDMYKI